MSLDKLVDSTQLDADLTSVANAIRTKGGTSASLAFPADFITAIGNISGGGGGLEYETGSFVPTEDISQPTINFKNVHATKPSFILIMDTIGTSYPNGCVDYWLYCNYYDIFGKESNSFSTYAAKYWYRTKTTSGSQNESNSNISDKTSTNPVSSSRFIPKNRSDQTTKFLTTRTYKWVAVWISAT